MSPIVTTMSAPAGRARRVRSGGVVQPFFSDSFAGGTKNNANGFTWGSGGPTVSSANPRTPGGYHLRATYNEAATSGTLEQTFGLGRQVASLWIEYYICYPSNYVHTDTAGADNNKMIRVWGGDGDGKGTDNIWYASGTKVGASTNPFGDNQRSVFFYEYLAPGEAIGQGPSGFRAPTFQIGTPSQLGTYQQIRLYFKVPSADGANDGAFRAWLNGTLVSELLNFPQQYSTWPWFNTGYFLGSANSEFLEDTQVDLADFSFYDQNPGW